MRLSAVFFLSIFLVLNTAFADISNFCQSVPATAFDDWARLFENRSELQSEISSLTSSQGVLATQLKNDFNNYASLLQGKTYDDIYPVMYIAAACYAGVDSGTVQFVKESFCPLINVAATNDAIGLALSAKAYVSVADSYSNKPAIDFVKSSPLSSVFSDAIRDLYSSCGSLLKTNSFIEPPSPEDILEELPGVCEYGISAGLIDFLWKPVSESNGKLVVLTNGYANVTDPGLTDFGASNGFCTTQRGAQSGAAYGKDIFVTVETFGGTELIVIPDGSKRYDCRGNFRSCGVDHYSLSEIQTDIKAFNKVKKQIRKLKVKRNAAKAAGDTAAFKKFKKKIKKKKVIFKRLKVLYLYAKDKGLA